MNIAAPVNWRPEAINVKTKKIIVKEPKKKPHPILALIEIFELSSSLLIL